LEGLQENNGGREVDTARLDKSSKASVRENRKMGFLLGGHARSRDRFCCFSEDGRCLGMFIC